jgi:quercetin dioxygenase-like cupin family protein
MEITKTGSKPSAKGPEDWFTGSVRIDPLFDANESRRAAAASVTFEPVSYTEKTLQVRVIILHELYSLCNNTE